MNWLTRRRVRKTQEEVDRERERLQRIHDDAALVAEVERALAKAKESDEDEAE